MQNTFKVLTFTWYISMLIGSMCLNYSCAETNDKKNGIETGVQSPEAITITGIVKSINFGKDGYTADVQTDLGDTYAALVSVANLGGPENYKTCEVGDKVSFKGIPSLLGDAKQLKVTEAISVTPTQTQLLISPFAFRGIRVGDPIVDHTEYIKKTQLKNGEGNFEVYEIMDFDNNPAGYLMADPKNAKVVGDITVHSPKAATAKGIKPGSTFADLLKVFPEIEVHGSEIEGRTHATANNLSYRLDMPNYSYKIDRAKIPATTKITEITINRGANAKALMLEAAYTALQQEDNCWQTNKVLNLYQQADAKSKVEGKHFAGETLKVLGTKMVGNQIWVNVTYLLTVKIGYEDQFADGRVTPSGSPTGWIGGADMPKINCK